MGHSLFLVPMLNWHFCQSLFSHSLRRVIASFITSSARSSAKQSSQGVKATWIKASSSLLCSHCLSDIRSDLSLHQGGGRQGGHRRGVPEGDPDLSGDGAGDHGVSHDGFGGHD